MLAHVDNLITLLACINSHQTVLGNIKRDLESYQSDKTLTKTNGEPTHLRLECEQEIEQ